VRALGSHFQDDENTIRLGESATVDLSLSYSLNKHAEIFLAADNLVNEHIETSRSTDGVSYVASPRFEHGGVRLSW
jgi:outer membrane cobalamin receptor